MLFLGLLLSATSLVAATTTHLNTTARSCGTLAKLYPNSTFFPGEARYDFENTSTAWLGPACAFAPQNTAQVSAAVKLFVRNQTPFSIRSGGQMPVADAANIGPEGILISSTNLTEISLSADKQVLTVQPGISWTRAYDFLAPEGVIANGIRIGNSGVIGFLLGGGIGFFSYEHGLASTGVISFECVLADGSVVTASATSHPELFWALRGGGNSFAIVTQAKLQTIPTPTVHLGNIFYGTGPDVKAAYIQGMADFAVYAGSDPQTAVEGQIRWTPSYDPEIEYWAYLFNSNNDTNPPGLANLTAPVLPFTSGAIEEQTMGEWVDSFKESFGQNVGNRELFHFFSIPADARAFTIAHDTYFSVINETIGDVVGLFTAFSLMPITPAVIAASGSNGGNPLGLSADSAPALWVVESPGWHFAADDELILAAHARANQEIEANLAAAGFADLPFVYLSDAQKGQSVFPTYGEDNVARLKRIRDHYDPDFVYTKLLPGGVKIAYA